MKTPRRLLTLALALAVAAGCNSTKTATQGTPATTNTGAIMPEKFMDAPFGHDESIASFSKSLPKGTKIRKLARKNAHYPSRTDTIYQFIYRKSEIFVYKSSFNKEILMAGSIANPQVRLVNGIAVGMGREQLRAAIGGIVKSDADTVKLSTGREGRTFTFTFKGGRLRKITFDSYYD